MRKNTKPIHSPPKSNTAKKYLGHSKKIGPQLVRLRQAIVESRSKTRSKSLSHDQFEEVLEFYIDSELRHEAVQKIYPTAWKHLQTCERCQSLHTAMTSPIDSSQNIPTNLTLPFLAPMPPNALWSKQMRSRVGGAPLQFGFIIQAPHLSRAIASPSSLVLRGDALPAQKSLLLSDTITFDHQEIAIDVWLYHPEHQNTVDLEISAVSSVSPLEPLRVTLIWNEHCYSSRLQNGKCLITAIPITDLETLRDLRVEFEAEFQAEFQAESSSER